MPAVPKPVSKPKEKNKYSSLQQKTPLKAKPKTKKPTRSKPKQVADWKKDILSHHNSTPNRKDRAEFPAKVVKELKEEVGEFCQCGCGRIANETHHVMPRTRDGRGVKTNGMRVNTICNRRFHDNEEELQYWIKVYKKRYGDYFWYDEQEWEEHRRREQEIKMKEQREKELINSYKPIVQILKNSTDREPTAEEMNLLRRIASNNKDAEILLALVKDIAS